MPAGLIVKWSLISKAHYRDAGMIHLLLDILFYYLTYFLKDSERAVLSLAHSDRASVRAVI